MWYWDFSGLPSVSELNSVKVRSHRLPRETAVNPLQTLFECNIFGI